MTMMWVGIGSAVAGVAGGLIEGDAIGDASDTLQQSTNQQLGVMKDMYNQQMDSASPFAEFGTNMLPMLGEVMAPMDREAELNAYYQSPEYAMMNEQARNQQLAASEATGGLGSTSTSNSLGAIAPQLGQSHLNTVQGQQNDLFNKLLSGVNIGMQGVGMQNIAGQNYSIGASGVMGTNAANQAQSQIAQGQNTSNMITGLVGSIGGMF